MEMHVTEMHVWDRIEARLMSVNKCFQIAMYPHLKVCFVFKVVFNSLCSRLNSLHACALAKAKQHSKTALQMSIVEYVKLTLAEGLAAACCAGAARLLWLAAGLPKAAGWQDNRLTN